jgi:membrane-associated phospholipid phosphatase
MTVRMRRLPDVIAVRFLPKGWLDLGRQLLLFCGAYYAYRIVRGLVDGRAAQAFANARELIDIERTLGVFTEPAINAWASGRAWLIDGASWMYVNSHFTVTVLTLGFLYIYRNEHFYFVRNMFMIAMGLALVLYVAFPTAPPRFMPEWGFSDAVADFTGVQADSASANLLFNPFAAVPSMHVAFALMLGLPMQYLVKRTWARVLWVGYPFLVTFAVVATANHWWLDAVLGAAVAAVGALGARALGVRRPQAWAFRPAAGVPA